MMIHDGSISCSHSIGTKALMLATLGVRSFGAILAILFPGLGITECAEFQFRKERSHSHVSDLETEPEVT